MGNNDREQRSQSQRTTAIMVRINVLNDCLRSMVNAERKGKRQVLIRPSSKVVVKFLQVMLKNGYINEFVLVDDHRAGKIVVSLNGRLNKCGVISPRYDLATTRWGPGLEGSPPRVCSGRSSSPPPPGSWTTRRPGGRRSEERSSGSSTERAGRTGSSTWTKKKNEGGCPSSYEEN